MAGSNKLSAMAVKSLNKRGRYGDGRGLWLQISVSGSKAWIFRYMRDGRAREMGLGPVSLQKHDGGVTLAEAREAAHRCHQMLRDGRDPIDERQGQRAAARLEKARSITFEKAAEQYVAAHRAGWKNPKHAGQWEATLKTYAYPVLGKLPVAAIDVALVLRVLEPIWTEKTETASRLRGRIESVLAWATVRGYRQGDNPARWRGNLDQLLPAQGKVQKVESHPALPYAELPAFLEELRALTSISAQALEFAVLTAARTGETIGAEWQEIDLAAKLWTVPAARMKSGREHRVPLPARALEILEALPREKDSSYVFAGARKKSPLSNMAMLQCLRGLRPELTVHGFRSTFRDWAAEQTNFPRELAEAALAHVLKDKTEAAYQRGDLLEKRRRLMDAWAKYCGRAPRESAKVTPLRPGRGA